MDGVNAIEERKKSAFWGAPLKPNPRRARGRAPCLKVFLAAILEWFLDFGDFPRHLHVQKVVEFDVKRKRR